MTQPWDRVRTLYSAAMLRQLTNPDVTGASSINDTQGNAAAAYAVLEFANEVGVSYDDSLTSHQFAINELVIFVLQTWANKLGEAADKREKLVYGRLQRLAKTRGGRNRVTAMTSSPDVPTGDDRGGTIANPTPAFDLTKFDRVTPNDPTGGSGGDSFPSPFPL